jgi:phospholipid N-methyltransferase
MASDGRLVTFTYAISPLVPAGRCFRRLLERSFARVTTSPTVWANLPPAFVYVCDGPIALQ